jgi:hypothetical protein
MTDKHKSVDTKKSQENDGRPRHWLYGLLRGLGESIRENGLTIAVGESTFSMTGRSKR